MDLLRKHGIGWPMYFNWKSKYSGASVKELVRLKELEAEEAENAKLKRMDVSDHSQPGVLPPRHPHRNAATVFCITPEAAEFFRRKHGISPVVLPHAIRDEYLDRRPETSHMRSGVVHVAGAIYGLMNLDAVRNAVDAVRLSARMRLLSAVRQRMPPRSCVRALGAKG